MKGHYCDHHHFVGTRVLPAWKREWKLCVRVHDPWVSEEVLAAVAVVAAAAAASTIHLKSTFIS